MLLNGCASSNQVSSFSSRGAEHQFRFDDGAAYERMMETWSRLVGDVFLDWLSPLPGLRWIDVGCGNGAFAGRLIERCAPAGIVGIDPSEAQLAFTRSRCNPMLAQFHQGSATALRRCRFQMAASMLLL
jgi:ubiquinone/menaquinone biosynthesis C-methylase UbiE